jgi:hemerythrin-like metal-binding protein
MSNMHDQNGAQEPVTQGNPEQDSVQAILQKVILAHEQTLSLLQQTETAYSRLIPRQLLTLLERDSIIDVKLGDQIERKLTIMFSDIRSFTPLSESMTPGENFEFINSYLSQMEPVIGRHRGIIDKYMGDTIMALFPQSADDAVTGAIAMLEKLLHYNAGRGRAGYVPIQIGIGLNTGMVIIGTVGGTNRMDSTVVGDAVNLASRIEEATKTYHAPLLISQNTLYDLADPSKYDIRFLDRIRVKGKTQPLSIYEIFDNDPADLRHGKRASKAKFEEAIAYYHLQKIPHAVELLTQCIKIAPKDIPAHIYMARCEEYLATGQHLSTGELDNHMEWRTEFQTGIEEIDKPHRRLFEKINDFIATTRKGDHSGILDVFAFLANHTQTYFKTEEELMRRYDYSFLESHLQEHKRFIENFMALTKEAEAGTSDPHYLSFRVQLLLFDWFTGHLAKTDRHMGRHLLGAMQRLSVTPPSV